MSEQSKETLLASEPRQLEPHEIVNQIVSGADLKPELSKDTAEESAPATPAESKEPEVPAQQQDVAVVETVATQSESVQIASIQNSLPFGSVEIISSLDDLGISDDDSAVTPKASKPAKKFKAQFHVNTVRT